MRVIPFEEKYRQDFIDVNKAWISEMFHNVEEQDDKEFDNIDLYLQRGGQIFVAVDDNDKAMAVCMIAPREDGEWEIMKLAARGMYTGLRKFRSIKSSSRLNGRISLSRW